MDATAASEMRRPIDHECILQAPLYGRVRQSSATLGEATTSIWGEFSRGGQQEEDATHDKRVKGLKTRDAAAYTTADYIDKMTREEMTIKCISGEEAGELGESDEVHRVLVDRGNHQVETPTTPETSIQENS